MRLNDDSYSIFSAISIRMTREKNPTITTTTFDTKKDENVYLLPLLLQVCDEVVIGVLKGLIEC